MKKPKYKNRRFYCCETCGRRYKLKMLVPSEGCCKDSFLWDSEKEYTRWCELKLMKKAGKISNLYRQIPVPFTIIYGSPLGGSQHKEKMKYVCDFAYTEPYHIDGKLIKYEIFKNIRVFIFEDCKGYRTKEYKKKKKLMEKVYGIVVVES